MAARWKNIPVLAVGKGWLVVEKPPGVSVHNEPGKDLCAMAALVLEKSPDAAKIIAMDIDFGIHAVHRLDKETSGLVLLAVDPESFRFLSRQFEAHQVKKRYTAILHGRLEKPEGKEEWGVWEWALAKTAGGRQNPQGSGDRQASTTRYRVLAYSPHYTLVELALLTGRKHQIRRHAKLSGHPVVGDARYGSTRAVKFLTEHAGFDRLALHAFALSFASPDAKKVKTVQTRNIPPAMDALFIDDQNLPAPSHPS